MLCEFNGDIEIVTEDAEHNVVSKRLSELLPLSFSSANYR
jgi:cytidine deaminase